MGLNWKIAGLTVAFLSFGVAQAAVLTQGESDYLTIAKVKVSEVKRDVLNNEIKHLVIERNYGTGLPGMPDVNGQVDPTEKVGKVIQTARDLVALGEDVYRLVVKGKPTNKTTYAPISVIPNVGGQPADILDTENWRAPKKITYEIIYTNLFNMDVVKFRYSVLFSYGGSYEGKGKYLTAAQIIPESAETLFGYDFTATMKLGGIQNNGTRAEPIAGATLLVEYTVSTVIKASNEVATHFILGNGVHKKL